MNLPDKLKAKLRDLPDAPGCYMMRDRQGRIIYVGKAVSLRKRVQSYFRQASLRRGSPKLRSLVNSVRDLDIVVVRNEAEAVLTEGRLIKDYKPRFNVSFRDDKRFLLLRANPRDPFPRFELCRIRRNDSLLYLGPYASSAAARAALDFVEKHYGLRKCAPKVPDATTYEHCLNDIIRFCSAPCVGKETGEGYRLRFDEACAFLRGLRPAVLQELRDAMKVAAEKLDFEKAGAMRDTLLLLEAAVRKTARAVTPPDIRETEARAGVLELQSVLGLATRPRVIEAYDISNISGTFAVGSMVCAVDGMPQRNRYRRFRIKAVEGIDDPAMMAEVIRRRFARLREEGGAVPDLVLVDGGITQFRAARRELKELGMEHISSAGLAKKLEEIYWKDGEAALRLPRASPALKVLQRIRDEAHRFALTYHRTLRSRLIRESILDQVPGIGKQRKRRLLEHFGSVRRLAKASEADIASVKGFGTEMAHAIFRHLHPDENGGDAIESLA